MNKIFEKILSKQETLSLAGGVIGANVGVYNFTKNDNHIFPVVSGITLGGFCGFCFGYIIPYAWPVAIISLPGYIGARVHSSLQESRQREEKLEEVKRRNPFS